MEEIPKTAIPMKLFSSPLRYIVGKMLTTFRNRVHYSKCAFHLEPLFRDITQQLRYMVCLERYET